MTLDNQTLARAVVATLQATQNTPALTTMLYSKDFREVVAYVARYDPDVRGLAETVRRTCDCDC